MARKRANTPPYVPRKGLRAVLDNIQPKKAGDLLTREDLHKRGLSSHLTYPALAALRFIGLLDDKDRLTGRHVAFNRENPDLKTQEGLVREAYGDFFEQVDLPLPNLEELKDRFQAVYELSDRVINSAFPLFQFLAQEAGIQLTSNGAPAPILDEPRQPVHRRSDDITEDDIVSPDALARLNSEEPLRIRHTGYQIVINLQVTKFTTEKDLIKMVRTANRAIHLLKKAGVTSG
jgi:hypothetical protein